MIRLSFIGPGREVITFAIQDRKVTYYDKIWKQGLLIMPLTDPNIKLQVKKMVLSRKTSLSAMGILIVDTNSGKNKEEYDSCKTDEAIANLIRKDCELKGLREIK